MIRTDFVKETSIKKDQNGYVLTGRDVASGSTNTRFLRAPVSKEFCGDVSVLYRQAITSAGSGTMAALDAERCPEQRHVIVSTYDDQFEVAQEKAAENKNKGTLDGQQQNSLFASVSLSSGPGL